MNLNTVKAIGSTLVLISALSACKGKSDAEDTVATAALGLVPLMFGSPVGKELELPLAQVVLGGLVTATLLNMVVVPTVYYRVEQWREKRQPTPQPSLNPQESPA